jgi:transcriptional regulator with XRE-family HTH domain
MGECIQNARRAAGLSQPQLARKAGLPVSSLRGYEQGRRQPGLATAARLAVALGCSLDELAGLALATKGKEAANG